MSLDTSAGPELRIVPQANWARSMTAQREYLVEVDLRIAVPSNRWPFTQEELTYTCLVDGGSHFTSWAVHDASVILHRFGGSYGPASFIVVPQAPLGNHSLWLTIVNPWGIPIATLELEVQIRGIDEKPALEETATIDVHPSRPASSATAQREISGYRIALWGPPAAGKTTFLAALHAALLDQAWELLADDRESKDAIVSLSGHLTDSSAFPEPTAAVTSYRWSLQGTMPKAIREWHWWGWRRRDTRIKIPLSLTDLPGNTSDSSEQYADLLARNSGIIIFFDPVSEFARGDMFERTYRTLNQLLRQSGRNGKLPHYVAVCITKFDDTRVFDSARTLHFVEYDAEPTELPRVPEDSAREFFTRLCGISRSDTASLVLPMLEQAFYEERIRFFVTSAIGFYVDRYSGMFNPDDYQNHIPGIGGEPDRIRSVVRPINVVEPLMWLARNLAGSVVDPEAEGRPRRRGRPGA